MNRNEKNVNIAATGIVLAGPYLTIRLVQQLQTEGYILGDQFNVVAMASLLLWSPLFFSIPALIQQKIRDAYKPTTKGVFGTLLRGLTLPAYLVRNQESRVVAVTSYVGLIIGAWVAVVLA
jgi:hypothetical protein